ncbi:MAG TPA: FeoB-associated Cys-rich membrane protein [Pirellulaceae bacterium]|nr:FeoB-associated Cys-rich membrane protein [Pirellulaceae bacterium]
MHWTDYLALGLFAVAAIVVAARAYRAFFGRSKAGCGSGCGSCSSNSAEPKRGSLLTIGSPPDATAPLNRGG